MARVFSTSIQVVLLALLGYGCFSAGDVLAKLLVKTYSPSTCLAYSSLVGLAVSSAWILKLKGWRGFAPPQWKLHLLRGFVIAFSTFMTLNALKRIPLSDFYGIVFLAPISVIVLATLIGHERFFPHRLLSAFLGFAGVLIIVGPQYGVLGIGALMALGSVAGITASALLMRRIGQGDDLPVYCFFPLLAIFLVNSPAAIADLSAPPLPDVLRFLAFGLLVIVGQIGTGVAFARAPEASLVAPTLYTQILWGILYGFLFFDHIPTLATLMGSSLIIGAGLFMIRKERKYKGKQPSSFRRKPESPGL